MTRERIDCPLLPIPTWDDIDRHTDEAYDRHVQDQIDDEAGAKRLDAMKAWPFPAEEQSK